MASNSEGIIIMPVPPETTQEIYDKALQQIETALGQETPPPMVAYNQVMATILSEQHKPLSDLVIDRLKEVFISTASEDGLSVFGNEFNLPRKPKVATKMTLSFPLTTGSTVAKGYIFTATKNNLKYLVDTEATAVANVATIKVTADQTGAESNLVAGQDELKVTSPIAGQLASTATIDTVDVTGAAQEPLEDWRSRLLFTQRSTKGGNSATDHKIQAEKIEGVRRVWPYTGDPNLEADPIPGHRFVYVEATSDIDTDGIAPQSLLDQVRESYVTDPETGRHWSQLGQNDSTLTVLSITRDAVYISINDLQFSGENLQSQWDETAQEAFRLYLDSVRPFVVGVDFEIDRNDIITDTSVSKVAQDVNKKFASSNAGTGYGLTEGIFEGRTPLNPGQLLKLGNISYV
jgi:hypothetical protein